MLKSQMSFLGHLSELRQRLWKILIAIGLGAIFIGFNIEIIIDDILFAPTQNDFITFKLLNNITTLFNSNKWISMPTPFPIQVRKMFEQVNIAISISIIGGIIISFPYLIFQVWKFISPALLIREKKKFLFFMFNTSFFFIFGILFGYFIISPLSIYFGYFFSISHKNSIITNIDLSNYINTIILICFGMGILFLIPVISQFLTHIEIITPSFLKQYRKHSIVIILFLSALITPPDAISMMITACPLLLLYELSIYLSIVSYKKLKNIK